MSIKQKIGYQKLYLKRLIEQWIFENSWFWYRDFNSEPKKKLRN